MQEESLLERIAQNSLASFTRNSADERPVPCLANSYNRCIIPDAGPVVKRHEKLYYSNLHPLSHLRSSEEVAARRVIKFYNLLTRTILRKTNEQAGSTGRLPRKEKSLSRPVADRAGR